MWTNFTWILSALALGVLIVGIVSTIVVRIDNIPKWRTVGEILIWLVGITIFRLLVWDKIHSNKKMDIVNTTPPVATSKVNGLPTVQPKEEWVLIWDLPPGQYDRGINTDTLEVRFVKNDFTDLWFETPYKNNGNMEVANYQLYKNGDKFSGRWSQYTPRDGGMIYLKKINDQVWTGQLTDRTGRSSALTLKRK